MTTTRSVPDRSEPGPERERSSESGKGFGLRTMTRVSMVRRCLALLVLVLLGSAATAAPIRVGSKNFSEQFIVAELYAGALEAAGYDVERKLNIGSTFAVHDAIRAGTIDVYPEYTGTGLITLLGEPGGGTDPDRVYDQVRTGYRDRFELEWLNRSAVNNAYVIVVRPDIAARYGLATLSDLARVSRDLNVAVTAEFTERPDGLPGLKAAYGIEFGTIRPFAGMRLRYEAMLQGRFEVANAFATDWQITARRLVALTDDRGVFPPYELAPVLRSAIARDAGVAAALNRVSEVLDTETMRRLNEEVELHGRPPREVAAEFLRRRGVVR